MTTCKCKLLQVLIHYTNTINSWFCQVFLLYRFSPIHHSSSRTWSTYLITTKDDQ